MITKYFLPFVCLLVMYSAKAQNFRDDYARFSYTTSIIPDTSKPNKYTDVFEPIGEGVYDVFGDTCINGLKYKFLNILGVSPPQGQFFYHKRWLLRIEPQRMFIYYPSIGQEKLLYDMTKTVGDTIRITPPKMTSIPQIITTRFDTLPGVEQMRIVKKDTTMIFADGISRKVLYFNGNYEVWVSEFGSIWSSLLDPFCKARFDSSYYGHLDYITLKGFFVELNRLSASKYTKMMFYKVSPPYPYYIPFYISNNCNDSSHPDTIQLDTSLCYKPSNYQNISITTDKPFYDCGDTIHCNAHIIYAPPGMTYQWIPNSTVVLKPKDNQSPTVEIKTQVPNPTCNKTIMLNIPTSCKFCEDTLYQPVIYSTKPIDTFHCPQPIIRTYLPKGGDTSVHWKLLQPLPIVYKNQHYVVQNIVYNQYCRDTIATDTLSLQCATPCNFPQLPCAHIEADKQMLLVGESIAYTAFCDSNCTGFQYQWDNGKSIEMIPENYTDTVFIKQLIYWNSYGIKDTGIHIVSIKQKSSINKKQEQHLYRIENQVLKFNTFEDIKNSQVYDMAGKQLSANAHGQYDMSDWSSGVYILWINLGKELLKYRLVK